MSARVWTCAALLLACGSSALSVEAAVGVASGAAASAAVGAAVGGGPSLLLTPPDELRRHFGWPVLAKESDKASAVWSALRKGIDPLDADDHAPSPVRGRRTNVSPRLRRQLVEASCAPVLAGAAVATESVSADGTQKLLLRLHDGLAVECVLIPISSKHTSLCVSSQVGCSRGCAFCSTGEMGLVRNLSPGEIVAQVWLALRAVREQSLPPLVNIVFMGMGEPLNNLNAVAAAVRVLTHPACFGLSKRAVCVSTVGPSPGLIAKAAALPCRLAWSVHAADDALRRRLVPTTAHTMAELRDAFVASLALKRSRTSGLVVELALLGGLNDSPAHAAELVALLAPFKRGGVLVNLIPYNDNGLGLDGVLFVPSPLERIRAFQRSLWDEGLLCTVRATRGDDERSACGQLATAAAAAGGSGG